MELDTSAPCTSPPVIDAPSNHGKKWTHEEDEHIVKSPCLSDTCIAQFLSRSEHAVKSRRAVMAAKLHSKHNGELSIQQCAQQMGADAARTATAIKIHGASGTKKNEPSIQPKGKKAPKTVAFSLRTSQARSDSAMFNHNFAATAAAPTTATTTAPVAPVNASIRAICDYIKSNNGRMGDIWTQDTLVPTLVQYHTGFQAYSAYMTRVPSSDDIILQRACS